MKPTEKQLKELNNVIKERLGSYPGNALLEIIFEEFEKIKARELFEKLSFYKALVDGCKKREKDNEELFVYPSINAEYKGIKGRLVWEKEFEFGKECLFLIKEDGTKMKIFDPEYPILGDNVQ